MSFKQFLFILPVTAFCLLCEYSARLAVFVVQHSPAAQAAAGLAVTGLAGGLAAFVAYRPLPVPEEPIADRIAREDAENIIRVATLVAAANQPPQAGDRTAVSVNPPGGVAPEGVGGWIQ